MGLYDGIKDVARIVQKADNIDLYQRLLDLGAQALELQAEVVRLKEENTVLQQKLSKKNIIERHKQPYITFAGDELNLKFCSLCWDSDEKAIQMHEYRDSGEMRLLCRKCGNKCFVNRL